LGGLFEESAKYLGLSMADLKTKLTGTSLGSIADKTAGKSRAGLVADLQNTVNAAIDKALAANKITKEQSDKAKAEAPGQIAKIDEDKTERKSAAHQPTAMKAQAGAAVTALVDRKGATAIFER